MAAEDLGSWAGRYAVEIPVPVRNPALNASSIAGIIDVEVLSGRKGLLAVSGKQLEERASFKLFHRISSAVYSGAGGVGTRLAGVVRIGVGTESVIVLG